MAQSPPPRSLQGLDHWVFSQSWGWTQHSDSTSPASSSDSSGSCPCYITRRPSQSEGLARSSSKAQAAPTAPRRARPAPAGGQRQSASEREKLRMRTLARALHELRRFLPPSVAPAGQSLTKIETLRLAIRYIGHLSAVLGLSEDSLQSRRRRSADTASSHRCPLCPDGGPSQAQLLGPGQRSTISSGVSWVSPPACPGPRVSPENLGSRISNVDPWVTPPYCPQIQSAPDTSHWTPPQAYSGVQTSPEPSNKTGLWSPSTASAELTEVYQVPGSLVKRRMEGALLTAVGEEMSPWDAKATSAVAVTALQQSPQPGEERMALGFTQRSGWKSLSVSPEPCLSLGSPHLLPRPSCQRLPPQPQWGCWDHNAEALSRSEDQGSSPAFRLPVASPIPSSGLQLSSCPELWQEDLEGPPLNIFY